MRRFAMFAISGVPYILETEAARPLRVPPELRYIPSSSNCSHWSKAGPG